MNVKSQKTTKVEYEISLRELGVKLGLVGDINDVSTSVMYITRGIGEMSEKNKKLNDRPYVDRATVTIKMKDIVE